MTLFKAVMICISTEKLFSHNLHVFKLRRSWVRMQTSPLSTHERGCAAPYDILGFVSAVSKCDHTSATGD